jgi:hypothetical protein
VKSKELPVVYISDELAQRTAAFLDSFARRRPSEGVVYWFGIEDRRTAVVTTLVVPNADTTAGSVRTSPEVNAEALGVIVSTPLVYLGQAHSHPGHHVKHSCFDDEQTFARFDGAISVVVPWFGRYGLHLSECGIYRHESGRFREVKDIDNHLRVVPGSQDLRTQYDER